MIFSSIWGKWMSHRLKKHWLEPDNAVSLSSPYSTSSLVHHTLLQWSFPHKHVLMPTRRQLPTAHIPFWFPDKYLFTPLTHLPTQLQYELKFQDMVGPDKEIFYYSCTSVFVESQQSWPKMTIYFVIWPKMIGHLQWRSGQLVANTANTSYV